MEGCAASAVSFVPCAMATNVSGYTYVSGVTQQREDTLRGLDVESSGGAATLSVPVSISLASVAFGAKTPACQRTLACVLC